MITPLVAIVGPTAIVNAQQPLQTLTQQALSHERLVHVSSKQNQ